MKSGPTSPFRTLARIVAFSLAFAQITQTAQAAMTDISPVPMAVKNSAKPNIMFMIDNSGSMSNIVPDTPYSPSATYLASCPAANILLDGQATADAASSAASFDLIVKSNRTPGIRKSNTTYAYGTGSGQRCFDPTLYYAARLNADRSSSDSNTCGSGWTSCNYPGSGYLDAVYSGHYLNWYFGAGPNYTSADTFVSSPTGRKAGTQSRMEIARTAATSVIDSFQPNRVRVGLFTYNSGNGGSLKEVMGDLDATKATAIKGTIDVLSPSGATPLAETLADIGKYFVTGYSGNLTLHPGQAGLTTKTVADVFPHDYNNGSGVGTPAAPIQYYCQKSFSVLMTDGRPQSDRDNIGTDLLDYDGDCSGTNASQCVASPAYDRKLSRTYESAGSDYLDDVALALREIDLRPDLTKPAGFTGKNNVQTYMIGFADEQAKNDPLMQDTATNGGGQFLTAGNAAELVSAFQTATDDILGKDGSASAVAVANAHVTAGDNASYQSSYNSGNWSGDLMAQPINVATGAVDVNDPIWKTGCANWNVLIDASDASKGKRGCSAQTQLDERANPVTSRRIVTYTGTSGSGQGRQFLAYNPSPPSGTTTISSDQQDLLNSPAASDGADVLAFIRGVEGSTYRDRAHSLGDIINAEPVIVRDPQFTYGDTGYAAYKTAQASRTRVVFQGANDGMLHAFNAATGAEDWAYVPSLLLGTLNNLSRKSGFTHKYYVDATPSAGDVDFSNTNVATNVASGSEDWHTILVGGLGGGGRGYYALDVTTPTASDEADAATKVSWEFPNSATNSTTVTFTSPTGQTSATMNANKIGRSFGKPVIVKSKAHGWVALVTSGYNNGDGTSGTDNTGGDGHGYLFVLNAKTGALLHAFDTSVGSVGTPSGLAHISAYVENPQIDNTVQYVYGGDLEGNVWRFDMNNASTANWKVKKLAALVDASNAAQPVTTEPELAKILINNVGKRFVYVGTGRYLGDSDVSTVQTQTMYGLIDDLSIPSGATAVITPLRSSLQQQTLTTSGTSRTITAQAVDYATKKGWYVDMPATGERINTNPVLALGALIFTSNIPNSDVCVPGGSSWLNVLDYKTGAQVIGLNWASQFLGNALASRPALVQLPDGGVKVLIRNSDATTVTKEGPPSGAPVASRRVSWKEITGE